jgi:flagellar hook-associated protein 3 FlgL
MRIASSTIFDIGTSGVQSQLSQLATLQEEISSGKSLNVPSDNPLGAAQAVTAQQGSDANVQYATNQSSATSNLQLEDTTLTSISTVIASVQTLLTEAGNPGLTDQERTVIGTQITAASQSLVSLGNTTDANGNYLFGGFQGTSAPFTLSANGTVTYSGDEGQQLVQVNATQSVAVSDPGSAIFESVPAGSSPGIAYPASTNTGSATYSAVSITNSAAVGNNDSYQVNFTVANGLTTYTVLDTTTDTQLNSGPPQNYTSGTAISLGGQSVTLTGVPANNDQFNVHPAQSTGTTTVTAATASNTGTGAISPVTVTDPQDPSIYAPYSVAFSVAGGVTSYTVTNTDTNVSAAPVVYTAPATVALGTGETVQITGAPANGDTFTTQQQNVGVNLFTTLSNVVAALNQPGGGTTDAATLSNALTTATAQVANGQNNVLTVRALVGAREQQLATLKTDNSTSQLGFSSTLSTLTSTDIVSAYSQYTETSVALQAAEKTFVQTESLTLFSIIQ